MQKYLPFMVHWLNAHLTIALPEEEYEKIKKHPEIKWGLVARKAMIKYLNELEKFEETKNQSKQSLESRS